ncbi:hypothetical protein [Helicobacter fennelliae]|uniref:Uncharacterized protein n=2 Tax=Helicobacter fennelliae TaxID=215 RepID=T1DWF1_9HELI|nr:hypothetical protein [Helicobacter fennelliae]GAD19568.1 hypothetical protein HFN_0808 [Helicobacter fennelliae MRY12-0050]SQB98505.1 Uncharacterised protein [Helicobacter fennelliae]STP07869.1 Uncharacterised protein [Helicobacter fennelliae]STQ84247.1 Uncharacterised protein [Helicobacter fennelliae]
MLTLKNDEVVSDLDSGLTRLPRLPSGSLAMTTRFLDSSVVHTHSFRMTIKRFYIVMFALRMTK